MKLKFSILELVERVTVGALLVVLAAFIVGPCLSESLNSGGNHWAKASRTAFDIKCILYMCEQLDKKGFDFKLANTVKDLRDAICANAEVRTSECEGEYLLMSPYGTVYQYKLIRDGDKCFAEISAEVPDYVPERWKKKMEQRIAVMQKPNKRTGREQ
jgi:hypothetical protein